MFAPNRVNLVGKKTTILDLGKGHGSFAQIVLRIIDSVGDKGHEQSANDIRWNVLQRRRQAIAAARAFKLFEDNSIPTILIKGLAAERLYPEFHFRQSADIDLAVSASDHLRAQELCNSQQNPYSIDLHRELRHLDTVAWVDLFENSRWITVEETPIRILRPEDNLRVLAVHWLNDGGASQERLWDIYYAVANPSPEFDWDRCLGTVSRRRRRWIICAIGLAHRYLDLDLGNLPFADEASNLPKWLVSAVEREWASDLPLQSLVTQRHDPAGMVRQIRKRLPPNPIQATIEMEGSFDARTRIHYQIGDLIKRAGSLANDMIKGTVYER